ncbi:hypothetical protein VM1G_08815 [Cytospora mali]|uniref:Uncharacterized protein n=1 Tax=Cytospora mali TaxID=578113 RepID=A0A194WAM7_CYTMA|nr:hypothetical protein VM1G_08815 [Valsa mali]
MLQGAPLRSHYAASHEKEKQRVMIDPPPPYDALNVPARTMQSPITSAQCDLEVARTIVNVCCSIAAGARIRGISGALDSHNFKAEAVAGIAEAFAAAVEADVDSRAAATIALADISLIIAKEDRLGNKSAAILAAKSIKFIDAQVAAATHRCGYYEHLDFWDAIISISQTAVRSINKAKKTW